MYNEEIKRRFLEEMARNKAEKIHFSSVFNAFCRFEQSFRADISEMTKGVVVNCLERLCLDETGTVRTYITVGNKYTDWCEANGYFSNIPHGFKGLSVDDVDISDAISKSFFRDELDLVSSIQMVHDLNSGYADAPVLALAWLGLTMKEVLALRDSDVDLDNRCIHLLDGSMINGFSDTIHDVLYRYSVCRISSRDKGNVTQEVVKDMSVDSFIKKMLTRGSKFFGRKISQVQVKGQLDMLVEKYEQLGFPRRHNFSNAWRSGRFYALYRAEQSGLGVFDFNNRPAVEQIFRHKKNYHDTIKMYRWYKKAFSLE